MIREILISLFPDWISSVTVAMLTYFLCLLWRYGREVCRELLDFEIIISDIVGMICLIGLIAFLLWLNKKYIPAILEALHNYFMKAVEFGIAMLIIKIYTHRNTILDIVTSSEFLVIAGVIILSYGSYEGYKYWVRFDEESKKNIPSIRKLIDDANNGDADAANRLGLMYHRGEIFRVNYDEAVFWYSKGCEGEYPPAMYNLGNMYYYGQGVEQNYAKALELYNRSSDKLDQSKWAAGHMYLRALGTPRNYKKAFELLSKAAANKYAPAIMELGMMYYYGWGVREDRVKALSLCKEAADMGYEAAQYNAGYIYEEGIDRRMKPDYKLAYYYYYLAHLGGHKDAEKPMHRIEAERLTQEESSTIRAEALRKFEAFKK